MFRRWITRFDRWIETHVDVIIGLVLLVGFSAIILFGIGKTKIAEKCPLIKTPDSLFALIIGVMTVFGLVLAFYSIRGLFERVTTFERVLKEASIIIKNARKYVLILGYYPGFGCVTLRGRGVLEGYKSAIAARVGEITFFITVHPKSVQVLDIKRIAKPYQLQPDELAESENFNNEIIAMLRNNTTLSPVKTEKQGVFIEITHVPDFHFVCNETRGVLFVPSRIPMVEPIRRPPMPAEVLGMVTSHVEFIEGAFEHYSGVNIINYMAGSIFIVNRPLRLGFLNAQYRQNLEVVGGISPYTWLIAQGNLPPGLNINNNTGEITGSPKQKGRFDIVVQVSDASHSPNKAHKAFTIQVK